ncbi:homoserine kinase-like isoform X2 [Musa acuminata AAA Group]|uniref:homoserine kinase-like isoform X2 n=1 Tax=Musa acuminata AAA Group TaxID=214697 RepID=UPI0031D61B22
MATAAFSATSPTQSRPAHRHRPLPSLTRLRAIRCSSVSKVPAVTAAATADPSPVFRSVAAFAPATVANLGPGFDFLGCAVGGGLGDTVTVSVDSAVAPGTLSIADVSGCAAAAKLSRNPLWNCAGIAGIAAMRMLGVRSVGLSLSLHKGLPLGSGLGSSAASAAAAALAVSELFGGRLSPDELVLAGLESEKKVSGYHADNVGPSILGGFVLIRSYDPFEIIRLEFPADRELYFVLVGPEFEAPTKKMREALPADIPMKDHVRNSSQAAALVAAVLQGNVRVLGSAMSADWIVEPRRAPLIPGMVSVKKAAIDSGAFGCTISGAGPTAVAVTDDEEKGKEIGSRMVEAFLRDGNLKASVTVAKLDRVGARVTGSSAVQKGFTHFCPSEQSSVDINKDLNLEHDAEMILKKTWRKEGILDESSRQEEAGYVSYAAAYPR